MNDLEFNNIKINNENYSKTNNTHVPNFVGKNKNESATEQKYLEKNNLQKKKQKAEKAQQLTKIATAFFTMVSAATISIFGADVISPPDVKAEICEYSASQNEIYYVASVESFEEDQRDFYVVLKNDFTNRSQKMEETIYQGYFENLQENMTYTLEIVTGSHVLASKTISTISRKVETEPDYTQNYPTRPNKADRDRDQDFEPEDDYDDTDDPTSDQYDINPEDDYDEINPKDDPTTEPSDLDDIEEDEDPTNLGDDTSNDDVTPDEQSPNNSNKKPDDDPTYSQNTPNGNIGD